MSLLRLILTACGLMLSLGCALAQSQDAREARRDGLIAVMADNAEAGPLLAQRISEYLAGMPQQDAFDAQADVLDFARKKRLITKLELAKGMLDLHKRYFPDDEIALDYWRYSVMIAAKQERGEISQEEFDYLQGRKIAEAKAALAANEQRQEAAAPAPATSWIGPTLIGIGNALRKPPVTNTNCVTLGGVVRCQSY